MSGSDKALSDKSETSASEESSTSDGKASAEILAAEISKLRDLFESCRKRNDLPNRFGPVADLGEDLRTLAESMSFSEVGQIADQLCTLIERLDVTDTKDVDLLGIHVESLRLVARLTRNAENSESVGELTDELSRAANRRLNQTWLKTV